MKKIYVVIILSGLIIVSLFSTCKLLDVEKEITFEVDLVVDETNPTFDKYELLDASAESSIIADYKDKIKSIELIKVEYTVISFVGPSDQQINTATLEVSDENGGGTQLVGTVTSENLLALLSTTKELAVSQAAADRIEDLIKNSPHKARFHYSGSANTGPLNFTARFYITVKMVANPLD